MKKVRKFGILIIMGIVLLSTLSPVYAAPTQSDVNAIQNKIEEKEKEIDEVQVQKSEVLKQVEKLIVEISEYEVEISDLKNKIDALNNKIKASEEQIKQKEEEYKKNKNLLDSRIVTMYEVGDTTFLDMLINSKGLTDFLSNYFYMSEMVQADTELLEIIENDRQEIEKFKTELEASKQEVEIAKKEQEVKANALKASKVTKEDYASQLSEEEKQLKADKEEFEADKRAIQEELARIAAQSNNTSYIVSTPSASGYIFPVAGLGKSNINNRNYPSYPGHTGIDVNINVRGKSIVAVKSGTVVTSTALKNANGNYRSYGEYIVIDHHDGTMTLYAHGLPGSRRVTKGDYVAQGQVIMTVGTTGNSTGLHLHFEVRVNGRCVNPLPYLP